jgi:hypothetical protein
LLRRRKREMMRLRAGRKMKAKKMGARTYGENRSRLNGCARKNCHFIEHDICETRGITRGK